MKFLDIQKKIFKISTLAMTISQIFFSIGIYLISPKHANDIQFALGVYVSLYLIYRFNPLRTIEFDDYDKSVAFYSGIFLFTSFVSVYITDIFNKHGANSPIGIGTELNCRE